MLALQPGNALSVMQFTSQHPLLPRACLQDLACSPAGSPFLQSIKTPDPRAFTSKESSKKSLREVTENHVFCSIMYRTQPKDSASQEVIRGRLFQRSCISAPRKAQRLSLRCSTRRIVQELLFTRACQLQRLKKCWIGSKKMARVDISNHLNQPQ